MTARAIYPNMETAAVATALNGDPGAAQEVEDLLARYIAATATTVSHLGDLVEQAVEKRIARVEASLDTRFRTQSVESALTRALLDHARHQVDWSTLARQLALDHGVTADQIEDKRAAWTSKAADEAWSE